MSHAFRLSKVDADKALANVFGYSEFLGLIFIAQIIVAIWSAVKYEGIITPWVAMLYIILWTGMLAVFGLKTQQLDNPQQPEPVSPRSWLARSFRYSMSFVIGLGAFGAMAYSGIIDAGTVFAPYAWAFFVYHAVLVAPSETIAFQGILPNRARAYIEKTKSPFLKKYADWLVYSSTQGVFAIAHYSAYQGSMTLIFTAWIFGMLFLYVAERWGLASAMGIHSAWNLTVVGVIGGVTFQSMINPSSVLFFTIIGVAMILTALVWKRDFKIFSFRPKPALQGAV